MEFLEFIPQEVKDYLGYGLFIILGLLWIISKMAKWIAKNRAEEEEAKEEMDEEQSEQIQILRDGLKDVKAEQKLFKEKLEWHEKAIDELKAK